MIVQLLKLGSASESVQDKAKETVCRLSSLRSVTRNKMFRRLSLRPEEKTK